ncbi:hypothetical protein LV35_04264 [Acinetobacter baumannii]|uniref:Uncharacterized protein n=1 Tax=Acinetobacter baumannii TaxID=470 RepID=A0AAJ0QT56_ACIBA|nr:hypothetical protein LV35_04264 [Acinetobacter baumannii]
MGLLEGVDNIPGDTPAVGHLLAATTRPVPDGGQLVGLVGGRHIGLGLGGGLLAAVDLAGGFDEAGEGLFQLLVGGVDEVDLVGLALDGESARLCALVSRDVIH